MDYQKKKLITQSVAFLQSHLHLTDDFLEVLARDDILTREEVTTVQKDATTSGKVLELVCMLKRKDTRTFNKFLESLESNNQQFVVQVLQRSHTPADVMDSDPRTLNVLESHLPDAPANILKDLCAYLVPSEVYHDDISSLQEQVTNLQRTLASQMYRSNPRQGSSLTDRGGEGAGSGGSSGGSSGCPTPQIASNSGWSEIQNWEVPTQMDDLMHVLKQKDDIIHRKDEEYAKLRKILADTQNDMQGVLDLNSQYLTIIGQLNQMQVSAAATPRIRDKNDTMLELEQQMEEAQERINKLQTEVKDIVAMLDNKQVELDKALKREKKYKEMLGLSMEADEAQVMERIRQLMDEGKMSVTELEKIQKELSKARNSRMTLEERVTGLEREKEKIEFHMRQQDLTMKKISRQKTAKDTLNRAESTLKAGVNDPRYSTQLKLPSIARPESEISLSSTKSRAPQYCMFCRAEFTPLKMQACRAHYRPIRRGRWTCCKDECHRSAGCMQLPHFYIEITVDKKIFLTDGARYMELTC